MADITPLFKATIKTVKSRNKAILGSNGVDKSILQTRKKTDFTSKTKTLIESITKLKEYLLEHRKEYINCGSPNVQMTDAERDQIDQHAENIMKVCKDAIRQLRNDAINNKVLPQVKEFREEVFLQIEKYLKGVCNIYSEQKAVRVKKVVNRKQISRLETEAKQVKSKLNEPKDSDLSKGDAKEPSDESEKTKSETKEKDSTNGKKDLDFEFGDPSFVPKEEEELSPEEAQMFADENQQLFEEMNNLIDEVKHIEGKVVEISKLQGIFAEKVLEQDATIDRIADTVVGTSENIIDANEDIREAMKNNAGLRVWILFILIVFTFSLLFLDWYNP